MFSSQLQCLSFAYVVALVIPYFLLFSFPVYAHPRIYGAPKTNILPRSAIGLIEEDLICHASNISFFDYSAKKRVPENAPTCALPPAHLLLRRDEDYSCSESKPCSNGACCPKATGFCNYGPEACGTNGQSPNDACWSNCDAHAECGINAKVPGTRCPLNVCCSQYGFCGMTDDFCTKGPDATTGCQSDCDQPGSGGSGGDVQSRVIGYYEAWAHDRACSGMDFNQIPVSALTHLYFSFGYITPGDFNVAPMDDLSVSLFSDLTAIKARNSDLKCIVALGGWTFNDNGTATQPVFSDMVSTQANRQKFIQNLFSFLREFAFDGVDFDWEYPGAPDRGGNANDGANFAEFLKELRDAIAQQPVQYSVSFTAPTSYWYLRGFDLAAVQYVDFVNVMSYDLHGTWDSNNPIGNHILAHTNLTEIKQALDLMWRNNVDPKKINLGLGFYGRSFQLSDPSCWQPGCLFLGGASPGPCTANSGTLSYREIMQVIEQNKLTPYYDQTNAVKYIVWNNDQWVSYDDKDTFKQKIDFANSLGLGGLLIWSIDQDTDDLQALSAVLAPKQLNVFAAKSGDQSYWQDATAQDCYVTGCGGSCNPGFIGVTKQPCGGAKAITRHSTEPDSTLCCPISSVPDTSKCTWRGTASSCNGQCHPGEVTMELNRWGSGDYCESGNKVYCCEVPGAKDTGCYWTGTGGQCNSGDELMTFAGTFLSTIADIVGIFGGLVGQALADALDQYDMDHQRLFCCPANEAAKWKNCAWHGQPGNCDDDHCDVGHQVQLATDAYGLGQSCAPRFERQRVFCCDPAKDGEQLFPPVPLDHLFPNPPSGDGVDTDFELQVDNTWGTGSAQTGDTDPNDASFAFVILTSPEELQVSLDKRDSPWELFECNDAVSEGEHTIKMICTDDSEEDSSGCGKIHLGHGAPGTILEMPNGCGPGKYAVAKSLTPSSDQNLPKHLVKRYPHKPTVYDLTFDYDFRRVPRDLGDTQMRIDFSNEVGYWDSVVEAAAGTKKAKRSLDDYGRNHKRWLEDEWRDDLHHEGLSKEELHKRWFGSDIIDWIKRLLSTGVSPSHTHNLDETFTAILVREEFECPVGGVTVRANVLAQAQGHVQVSTTFGLTIITKLSLPLDLSQSYLYFANKGKVEAIFTMDALAQVQYSSGDKELFSIPIPGASFSIPGIVKVGPVFSLVGLLEAQVTFAGHLESKVELASWNVRQTFPDQGGDYVPTEIGDAPDHTGTDKIGQPTFDFSVSAKGDITAHLKPTFSFGIKFQDTWNVDPCQVQLVADGYVRLYAEAQVSSSNPNCPFTYGVDVGADLYAHVDAPSVFGWNLGVDRFDIAKVPAVQVIPGKSCPIEQNRSQRRALSLDASSSPSENLWALENSNNYSESYHSLGKRDGQTYGPIFVLNIQERFCPKDPKSVKTTCNFARGFDDSYLDKSDSSAKRDLLMDSVSSYQGNDTTDNPFAVLHHWEKRNPKKINYCASTTFDGTAISPDYYSSGEQMRRYPTTTPVYGPQNPDDCANMNFVLQQGTPADTSIYSTEHILEFQMLPKFFDYMSGRLDTWPNPLDLSPTARQVEFCEYFWLWYFNTDVNFPPGTKPYSGDGTPYSALMFQFPSKQEFTDDWMLLIQTVNSVKERMWSGDALRADKVMEDFIGIGDQGDVMDACAVIKSVAWALQYHVIADTILTRQVLRIRDMFNLIDNTLLPGLNIQTRRPYQTIGIGALWQSWMHDRAILAKSRAETFTTGYLNAITAWYDPIKDDPAAGVPAKFAETYTNLQQLVAQQNGAWTPGF